MAPLNALLPLLAALSAPSALAAGQGEAVFARVTQRNFGHQEEVSIRFTPEKAVLVLNSNFLQAPGVPARLGVWEAPLNEALKIEYRELLLRKNRMEARRLPPDTARLTPRGSPYAGHGYHYFVGETEVGPGTAEARHVGDLLADPWRLAEWKPVNAVEITPERARSLDCRKHSPSVERCVDRTFGVAYLPRTARPAAPGPAARPKSSKR